MTPKEKAKELVDIFSNECLLTTDGGKAAALIAVDEIINSNPHSNAFKTYVESTMSYWNEVKQEIEML